MSDDHSKKYDPSSAFDDSNLPENNISKERMKEIDKLVVPHLSEALKKLKKNEEQQSENR